MEYKISDLETKVITNLPDMETQLRVEDEWIYTGRARAIRIFPSHITAAVYIDKCPYKNNECNKTGWGMIWQFEVEGFSLISDGKPLHIYREQLKKEALEKGIALKETLFDALFGPIEQKLLDVYAQNMEAMQ